MWELSSSNHGDDWSRAKEIAQSIEERSFLEVMVMLLGKGLWRNHYLDGHKFVTFSFKSGNNFWNLKSTETLSKCLEHAAGLNSNVNPFTNLSENCHCAQRKECINHTNFNYNKNLTYQAFQQDLRRKYLKQKRCDSRYQSSLHSIWLDGNKCSLHLWKKQRKWSVS